MTNPSSPYNHPDQPVRHSYPVAITEAGLSTSFGLLMKTLPYVAVRLGLLVAFSVITILWMGATFGGFAFLADKVHPWVGYGWMATGMGVYGWIWVTIVRYFLYVLKCGHIAVLTELITTNKINHEGMGMFAYGKKVVTDRFAQVNVLFVLDSLIEGVVRAFNRTLDWIAGLIPIPGLQNVTKVINSIIYAATTYIDETIFSYNLARGEDNPWRGGRDGLVYYCQNSKTILKTAIGCVLLDYVLTALVWVLLLAPTFLLAKVFSGLAAYYFGFAILIAWNIRAAVLKPLFLTMIMTKFHVSVKGQAIDETWDARLTKVSNKFVKIKDGIQDWWKGKGEETPASSIPPPEATPAP